MKKSTIQDVANLAGVSKSTVSKYINNTPYVSIDAQRKIESAIQQLDFQPNSLARGLVNKSTGLIGLVISDFDNLINKDLIKAIEIEARKHGYNIVLVSTNDDDQTEKKISEILGSKFNQLEGVILATSRHDELEITKLKEKFEHIVLVHRHVPNEIVDYAIVDGYIGGRLATEYLIGLGHEKITMLNGIPSLFQYKERRRGFEDVLEKYGISDQGKVFEVQNSVEGGYHATEKILFEPGMPTAIFASTDMIALGVLDAARHYNIKIPEDLSVIGFDNIFFSRLARVPLTTIDGRIKELGTVAFNKLIQRIEGSVDEIEQIVLQPSLVVRESCKSIN
jgi:DNA-binding LacI/PurR family transcriptional regulator